MAKKKAAKSVKTWRGLALVDAKHPRQVVLTPEDITESVRKDEGCCALATGIRRMYQSRIVEIWRTVAYVSSVDENGKEFAERYMIDERGQKWIASFDKGDDVPVCTVTLQPPSPHHRLGSESQKAAIERSKLKRQQEKAAADAAGEPLKPAYSNKRRHQRIASSAVRSGTGRVHTTVVYAHGKPPVE